MHGRTSSAHAPPRIRESVLPEPQGLCQGWIKCMLHPMCYDAPIRALRLPCFTLQLAWMTLLLYKGL
eukprot:4281235-Pleurochrysis_carterae.AAC.1